MESSKNNLSEMVRSKKQQMAQARASKNIEETTNYAGRLVEKGIKELQARSEEERT